MQSRPKILYLVHDLYDASVHKRVCMLRDGGALVTVMGFRRSALPVVEVSGCSAINLGQTHNGRFLQRLMAVVRELFLLGQYSTLFSMADIIIARNVEMLALAVRGRSIGRRPAIIAYECLDIHRIMLNSGRTGRSMRWLEGWLSKRASLLITSSLAFTRHYFNELSSVRLPVMLVENKVYAPLHEQETRGHTRRSGPPWRIGWFGAIRCRKSLQILTNLVRQSSGTIEVIIRGKPALDQFEDFYKEVTETPGLSFIGPYRNPEDLYTIYHDVHFTWAIDMYEEGQNSSWLLPNRLYEGGLYGSIPIAEANVETGRFLNRLGIGVIISEPKDIVLASFFHSLTLQQYRLLEQSAMCVPQSTWRFNTQDCRNLVAHLCSFQGPRLLTNHQANQGIVAKSLRRYKHYLRRA